MSVESWKSYKVGSCITPRDCLIILFSFPPSLFNVPGTSSAGTMRPNSVAVSNLSSSGSGADYAAKVAFIGKKYRKT